MKKRPILLLIILCISFGVYCFNTPDEDYSQFIVWNTGQGLATTALTTEVQPPRSTDSTTPYIIKHAALIDGGSSAPPPNQHHYNEDAPTRIANHLNRHFQDSDEQHLHVLITHPDEDHINLIQAILTNLKPQYLNAVAFYLGSTKEKWGIDLHTRKRKTNSDHIPTKPTQVTLAIWDLSTYIEALQERFKTPVTYGDDPEPSSAPAAAASAAAARSSSKLALAPGTIIPMGPYMQLKILANTLSALRSTQDSNDHSLVTLIETKLENTDSLTDQRPLAFLVPGDATQTTLTKMGGKAMLEGFVTGKQIIAIASHHGSQLDCNTKDWIDAIKASFVICTTAASHEGFKHPDARVLAWYSRYAIQTSPHPITTFINFFDREVGLDQRIIAGMTTTINRLLARWSERGEHLRFSQLIPLETLIARVLLLLETAVYSTADSGDIAFTWKNGTNTFDTQFFPPNDAGGSAPADSDDDSSGRRERGSTETDDDDDDSHDSDDGGGGAPVTRISLRDTIMLPPPSTQPPASSLSLSTTVPTILPPLKRSPSTSPSASHMLSQPALPPLNLRASSPSPHSRRLGTLRSVLADARTESNLQLPPPPLRHPFPRRLPPLESAVTESLSVASTARSSRWYSHFSERVVTEGQEETPLFSAPKRPAFLRQRTYRPSLNSQQAGPPPPPASLLQHSLSPTSFISIPDQEPSTSSSDGETGSQKDVMET